MENKAREPTAAKRDGAAGASAWAFGDAKRDGGDEDAPRIRSRDLFGSARRVIIDHDGRQYCLLITRQGKLILNRGG